MSHRSPAAIKGEIAAIMDFYHPRCLDEERGGFFNGFLDDGTIYDRDTRHIVSTCRFIFNFAVSSRVLEKPHYLDCAKHGLSFLQKEHRQKDGSYAWVLGEGNKVIDGTRHCYGHAFALLATAAGATAGMDEAKKMVGEIDAMLEERFWEPDHGLYVDEIAAKSWDAVNPYRGQNANMHMCDAMYWAARATGEKRYLDRAILLAKKICVDLAEKADGWIWEHYTTDWIHDWGYNKDDPKNLFRPYGFLSGHFVEWAKILLALERRRQESWMLPAAKRLFDDAMDICWDKERGGLDYTFSKDRKILDTDRYYWVMAEAAAASAALAKRTGDDRYWDWYDRIWEYTSANFIDHEYGGWYRVLDRNGNHYDNQKSPPAKADYHPLAACVEILEVIGDIDLGCG